MIAPDLSKSNDQVKLSRAIKLQQPLDRSHAAGSALRRFRLHCYHAIHVVLFTQSCASMSSFGPTMSHKVVVLEESNTYVIIQQQKTESVALNPGWLK